MKVGSQGCPKAVPGLMGGANSLRSILTGFRVMSLKFSHGRAEVVGTRAIAVSTAARLRHLQQRQELSTILSWLALFVGLAIFPLSYFFTIYSERAPELGDVAMWRHIYLNASANTFVMIAAARAAGRLDLQIAVLLTSVIMAHGAAAYLTLALRIYYSNQVILIAAAVSLMSAFLILALRRQFHQPRAAVVGPWHPIANDLRIAHDHLSAPGADLRAYDLVLTTSAEPPAGWTAALTQTMMAGKPIRHVAEYLEEEQGVVSIEHFTPDHLPVGGLTSYQARKRLMDIGLVILTLPVAVPLLLFGVLGVWATMGQPVFFVQPRVGLGGKVFRMYKLRTMRPAKPHDGELTTVRHDARVTRLGLWLRRFRIDELPQLWNVLKGDMSLIGPRPEQPGLTEAYCRDLPAFEYRSLVRPGITGWAQVRAGYAADLEETRVKLAYDLFYLKNFSYSLDLQIILRTAGTLLTGGGVR